MAKLKEVPFDHVRVGEWINYTRYNSLSFDEGIFARAKANRNCEIVFFSKLKDTQDTYQLLFLDVEFEHNKEIGVEELVKEYNLDETNLDYLELLILAAEYYGYDQITKTFKIQELNLSDLKQQLSELQIHIP